MRPRTVTIRTARSQVMTVTLKDVDNSDLWSVDIEPRPDARTERLQSQHF